jgi:thymidylate synthase
MRSAFEALLKSTLVTSPMRKKAVEITGVHLILNDPRARLSSTETRGRPFSCLGEFLWYMSGSDSLDFIRYYIPQYAKESEDGLSIHGAYGQRLFDHRGVNQVKNVIKTLANRKDTRRATIQIFDSEDLDRPRKQVPCTCSLQFLLRNGKLDMIAMMRSNDAYIGLPHDTFCFTLLQEVVARAIGADVGAYHHMVGSLHLYDRDRDGAAQYLAEGFQPSVAMPRMPVGDPWLAILKVLEAERRIRSGLSVDISALDLDPFWADLVRLLQAFAQTGHRKAIEELRDNLAFKGYDPYLRYRAHMPPRRPFVARQPTFL